MSKPTGIRKIQRLEDELRFKQMEYEANVKHLEETIYGLRRDLVATVPSEIRAILLDRHVLPEDLASWERETVNTIIETAVVIPAETPYHKDRAECPLCGGTPGQEAGYAMPLGLERHLYGNGQVERCTVIRAAIDLHEHRDQSFRSAAALRMETRFQEHLRSLKAKNQTP